MAFDSVYMLVQTDRGRHAPGDCRIQSSSCTYSCMSVRPSMLTLLWAVSIPQVFRPNAAACGLNSLSTLSVLHWCIISVSWYCRVQGVAKAANVPATRARQLLSRQEIGMKALRSLPPRLAAGVQTLSRSIHVVLMKHHHFAAEALRVQKASHGLVVSPPGQLSCRRQTQGRRLFDT